jgi:hypothetical protein
MKFQFFVLSRKQYKGSIVGPDSVFLATKLNFYLLRHTFFNYLQFKDSLGSMKSERGSRSDKMKRIRIRNTALHRKAN